MASRVIELATFWKSRCGATFGRVLGGLGVLVRVLGGVLGGALTPEALDVFGSSERRNLSKTASLVPALVSAPFLMPPYFLFGFVFTNDLLRSPQIIHRS